MIVKIHVILNQEISGNPRCEQRGGRWGRRRAASRGFFLQTINSFDQISKSLLLKFLHVCQQNTSSLSSVSSLSSFHLISLFIPGGSLRRVAFAGSPSCSCPGKPCPVQASSLFKIVKKLSHKNFWQALTSEKTLSQLQPTFKTDLANK